MMLVAGLDVRIVTEDGELLRELILDPTRSYQPLGAPNVERCLGTGVHDVPRHHTVPPGGIEPPHAV